METILCPNCGKENSISEIYCNNCNYPIGPNATTDPVQTAFAEGTSLGKGIKYPKKFIVVLGIWALFGLFGILCFLLVIEAMKTSPIAILFGIIGAFLFLIPINTTRKYLEYKKELKNSNENEIELEGKEQE